MQPGKKQAAPKTSKKTPPRRAASIKRRIPQQLELKFRRSARPSLKVQPPRWWGGLYTHGYQDEDEL
jgi:hypothetical protein